MTAKETFFLEAGFLPVRNIIAKRSLLYSWQIMHRKDEDLLNMFYQAQKVAKTKNDWVELIENDKTEFEIDVTDEEISSMGENKFKTIVNAAVTERTLKYMNKIAAGHSKSKTLVKAMVDIEKYLDDQRFSRSDAELLFCLRTRMLDFKMNFSSKYGDDISCRICHVQVECQNHI